MIKFLAVEIGVTCLRMNASLHVGVMQKYTRRSPTAKTKTNEKARVCFSVVPSPGVHMHARVIEDCECLYQCVNVPQRLISAYAKIWEITGKLEGPIIDHGGTAFTRVCKNGSYNNKRGGYFTMQRDTNEDFLDIHVPPRHRERNNLRTRESSELQNTCHRS